MHARLLYKLRRIYIHSMYTVVNYIDYPQFVNAHSSQVCSVHKLSIIYCYRVAKIHRVRDNIGHFLQISLQLQVKLAENDLYHNEPYGSSPPCIQIEEDLFEDNLYSIYRLVFHIYIDDNLCST